jgi:hypothetical protein
MNTFVLELGDESGDVEVHLDHQEVRTAAGSENLQGSLDVIGMRDLGTALHRNFRRCRKLTTKCSDN